MRTEQVRNYLATNAFAVSPQYLQAVVGLVNSGEIAKETNNEVSQSHSYAVSNGVAVIAVDGATTKKNTWMNAMCGGFVGYDTIATYVNQAKEDKDVHTILFHVDTAGGDVAGVDELAELIFNTEKKTVTFYENLGASAGIWWGSASDDLYANKTAEIGSIGVMAGYYEPDREDDKKVVIVSRNAENKNCALTGDCKEKFQAKIDNTESIFHERVSRNTGLTKEEIVQHFNYGETISADKAHEIGFLDGITTLDALAKTLSMNPPTMGQIAKQPLKVADNSTQGIAMNLEEALKALDTANTTIEANKTEMVGMKDQATALTDQNTELLAQVEKLTGEQSASTDAVAVAEKALADQAEVFEHAVSVGFKMKADKETMLLMAKAEDKDKASALMMDAMTTDGATIKGAGEEEDTNTADAENVAERASAVGVTILSKG